MTKILYLVHDLSDAAVRRRVMMLQAGGAQVRIAGFRRTPSPILELCGEPCIDLGQTADGAFVARLKKILSLKRLLLKATDGFQPDLILARNLEMLLLARRILSSVSPRPKLIYEILDIHRMLLRQDGMGQVVRGLERWLMASAQGIITSSPAFIDNYFKKMQHFSQPVLLVENKMLTLGSTLPSVARPAVLGRPLRIGWFGILRCAKSLALLDGLARHGNGAIEVVLRGRPAYQEFADFKGVVAANPYLRFEGAYRWPDDLASIYGEVDLAWAIDFFEEGLNSAWLLPNRIYEGCAYGAVPITAAGTQTARFAASLGLGYELQSDQLTDLITLSQQMTASSLAENADRRSHINPHVFSCDKAECVALVTSLREI